MKPPANRLLCRRSESWIKSTCHPRTGNFWLLNQLLRYEPFKYRKPSPAELEIVLEAFNEKSKRLAFKDANEQKLAQLKILKLWSALRRLELRDTCMLARQAFSFSVILSRCRLWQGSPHASNSTELQTLKNAMYANQARVRTEQKEEIKAARTTNLFCCTCFSRSHQAGLEAIVNDGEDDDDDDSDSDVSPTFWPKDLDTRKSNEACNVCVSTCFP